MALVTNLKKTVHTQQKPPEVQVSLPTEPNVPSDDLSSYSILLYGAKKIGKTSLASRFPDAFFLACEPGTKALRVFSRDVHSWEEFLKYLLLLRGGKHKFKTVVVDTIDLLYEYAFQYICRKKMINHPSEEDDFGATWKEITEEFKRRILEILSLNMGVIFISHDIEREVELRDGRKIDRVQPTMSKQAMSVVEAVVDIMANYSYDGKSRILTMEGAQDIVAGCRVEEHFIRAGGKPRTPGDRIISIDMGRSAEESYQNFLRAFHNEQKTVEAFSAVANPPIKLKK